MPDEEIYKEPGISITPTLVKINSATYSVANIGSVYITQQSIGGLIIVAIIFGVLALGGAGALISPDDSSTSNDQGGLLGITVVFGLIAAAALTGIIKRKYYLTFRTSSSDQRALASTDKSHLMKLQAAIELAITKRG